MKKSTQKFGALSAMVGACLFVILTALSMLLYSGGYVDIDTVYDSPSYSFMYNYFSDLGRLTKYTGGSNLLPATLFTAALTFCGIGGIFYAIVLPSYFPHDTQSKRLAVAGAVITIMSMIGYIGIGWTPLDVSLGLHLSFVYTGFSLSLPFSILNAAAIFKDKKYPKIYGWINAIFSVISIAYLCLMFLGPSAATTFGRLIQVGGQKIMVYISMITVFFQAMGSYKICNR